MPTTSQLFVWVVVGLIGGSLAGRLITWKRGGFGLWPNLGLGLVGALIGGFLFRVFDWWPYLNTISVSLRDIIAATAGSLLVLLALWIYRQAAARA